MSEDDASANAARTGTEAFRGSELAASLTVDDIARSLAWYRDVVGFAVARSFERDGELQAVSLRAGDVRILLTRDDGARGERTKGEGFSLQITTADDVDAIAQRIEAAGGSLDTPPSDTPWGPRIFRVRDPDGFKLVFSTGS